MAAEVTVSPQVPGVKLPSDADKRAKQILDDAETWGAQLHSIWVRLLKRERAAILAKVGGSKARQGTKFWDGGIGFVATKAYDPRKWIDKSRWLGELEGETKELLVRFFRAYFKRAGMKDDMARKLADKLTNERVDPALEYHEAYLDRLGEHAREVAEREGSTIEDVANVITVAFDEAEANSESVAISNMIGSQNQAQLEMVQAAGLKGKKVWFSAMDHRVRPHHRKPTHGQRRDFDKPFDVDGEAMQYPGDRSAPIGLWVNCRCVLLFYPTVGGGGDGEGDALSGQEAAAQWMGLQADLTADILEWKSKKGRGGGGKGKGKGPRKVRTAEGVRHFDLPIGSPIVTHPDLHLLHVEDTVLSRPGSKLNPHRTSSAREAAEHLARGDHVRLDRPRQATVLIKELRKLAKEAEARGEQAPVYDLCKVTVKDTSLFCLKSKGIPRVQMPQLTGLPIPGSRADNLLRDEKGKVDLAPYFLEHLAKHGAIVHHDLELASRLMASQNQLDGAKVGRMMRRIKRGEQVRELFVSDDNYIVDGHHHWAATVGLDVSDDVEGQLYLRVARVDMGIIELLDLANDFAGEWGIQGRGVEGGEGKGLFRRVRTPGGQDLYDQPIGTVIRPDVMPGSPRVRIATPLPPIRDFSAWGERGRDIHQLFDTIDRGALLLPEPHGTEIDPRTVAALRQIYEYHDDQTGLTQKVGRIDAVGLNRWRVGGIIEAEDHNIAGHWEKTIDLGQEPPGAFHGLVELSDRYQGQGFGERLLRHEENAYVALGVDHIDLLAGLEGGGYAWARAGFDWHHSPGAFREPWFKVRQIMEQMLNGAADDTPERDMLLDMLGRFDEAAEYGPEYAPTPYEIAMLGYEGSGQDQYHFGKRIMRGSEWEARKTLVPARGVKSWQLERARWLAARAEEWWQECEAQDWRLGEDGLDWALGTAPDEAEEDKADGTLPADIDIDEALSTKDYDEYKLLVRRVRTTAGVRRFHRPIGAPIFRDELPDVRDSYLAHARRETGHLTEEQRLQDGFRSWLNWEPAKEIRMAAGELVGSYDDELSPQLYEDFMDEQEIEARVTYGAPPYRGAQAEELDRAYGYVGYEAEARALLHALDAAEPYDGELWRHVNVPLDQQRAFDDVIERGKVDLPLEAFGDAAWFVQRFDRSATPLEPEEPIYPADWDQDTRDQADSDAGEHGFASYADAVRQERRNRQQGEFHVPVVIRVLPGAKAITGPREDYRDRNRDKWQEWITGGRFEVVSDEVVRLPRESGEAQEDQTRVITLRQVEVLLPDDEEKAGGGFEVKLVKVRKVRTAAGSRFYKLPIGAPIVARQRLPKGAPARITEAATVTPEQDRSLDALREHPVNVKLGKAFRDQGHQLYLVGGSVRDAMAGHPDFADLDYTTDATPEDVKRITDHLGPQWGIGEAFGTVGIQIDGLKTEITTFRKEEYEEGSRNPIVAFGDNIEEDLARRDLTMNAMALVIAPGGGHRAGELVDPHDGAKDLDAGILRTPDDPQKSMTEDPLRQLRVVRFAAKRNAKVDPALAEAVQENRGRLSIIAAERKTEELRKVLKGGRDTTLRAITVADQLGITEEMFGGLVKDGEGGYNKPASNRIGMTASNQPVALLGALALLRLQSGDDPQQIMSAMKLSNEEIRPAMIVAQLAREINATGAGEEIAIRRMVRSADPELMGAALTVADGAPHGGMIGAASRIRGIRGTTLEQRLRGPLPIDGRDLIAEGLKGPEIGAALERLTGEYVMFPTMSREEALAVALGKELTPREGEEISAAWANALEGATMAPGPGQGNYWLLPDGRFAPVSNHASVFPPGQYGYDEFVAETGAVRIVLAGKDAFINLWKPLSDEQIDALAASARRERMAVVAEPEEGQGYQSHISGMDYEHVVATLKRASDSLVKGRAVRYPSRLAQFKSEEKVAVRHVRTPEGVELFDQAIGEIIRPDLPTVHFGFLGDADAVTDHESDPDRSEKLLDMYREGLPLQDLIRDRQLAATKNRAAAKKEVVASIHAHLDTDQKTAIAREEVLAATLRIRRMLEDMDSPDSVIKVPTDVKNRVLAQLDDPFGPNPPNLIWTRFEDDEDGPAPWRAPWYDNIVMLTGIPDPEPERGNDWDPQAGTSGKRGGSRVTYLRGVDNPEIVDALSLDEVSDFIGQWASTSNDQNVLALTIQNAIRDEFGLDGAMDWPLDLAVGENEQDWAREARNRLQQQWDEEQAKVPLYRSMIRAMYDNTQEWLAKNGVDEMLVYRGMQWSKKVDGSEPPPWFDDALFLDPVFEEREVEGEVQREKLWPVIDAPELRPASSWAWGSAWANAFAGRSRGDGVSRDNNSAVMATVVPREAILSTPRTGFGALPEEEVVVLDFGGQVRILAAGEARKEMIGARRMLEADAELRAEVENALYLDDRYRRGYGHLIQELHTRLFGAHAVTGFGAEGQRDRKRQLEMAVGRGETKAAVKVRKVRTAEGVQFYKLPVGSPIVAHPDLPSLDDDLTIELGPVFDGDVSKVENHLNTVGEYHRLVAMYGKGLPEKVDRVLWDDKNRQAAKKEVVERIQARLSPEAALALAREEGDVKLATARYQIVSHVPKGGDYADRFPTDPLDPRIAWVEIRIGNSTSVSIDINQTGAAIYPDVTWSDLTDSPTPWRYIDVEREQGQADKDLYTWLRNGDPRIAENLTNTALSSFIHSWAETSNDASLRALAIQEAIRQEFGLDAAMEWHLEPPTDSRAARNVIANQEKEVAKIPLYRELIRAQYDETQAWLKENGITEMLVYRGMKWESDATPPAWFDQLLLTPEEMGPDASGKLMPIGNGWRPVDTPELRPASSWAFGGEMANQFATGGMGDTYRNPNLAGAVMRTVIPAAAILATPRTGFGALPEEEVVVLDFGGEVEVMTEGVARLKMLRHMEVQRIVKETGIPPINPNFNPEHLDDLGIDIAWTVDVTGGAIHHWYPYLFAVEPGDVPKDLDVARAHLLEYLDRVNWVAPADPTIGLYLDMNLPEGEVAGLQEALDLYDLDEVSIDTLRGWYAYVFLGGGEKPLPPAVYDLTENELVERLRGAVQRAKGAG